MSTTREKALEAAEAMNEVVKHLNIARSTEMAVAVAILTSALVLAEAGKLAVEVRPC